MKARSNWSLPFPFREACKCIGAPARFEIDLLGNVGALPVDRRDAGPLLADVACHEVAIMGQRQRHCQSAITRERTDFEETSRTDIRTSSASRCPARA